MGCTRPVTEPTVGNSGQQWARSRPGVGQEWATRMLLSACCTTIATGDNSLMSDRLDNAQHATLKNHSQKTWKRKNQSTGNSDIAWTRKCLNNWSIKLSMSDLINI